MNRTTIGYRSYGATVRVKPENELAVESGVVDRRYHVPTFRITADS